MGSRTSTNALTRRYLTWIGIDCQTVQTFYGGRRHDLLGIADTVALFPMGLTLIQNCSEGSLSSHRKEIDASKHIAWLDGQVDRHALHLHLWEWRKRRVGRRAIWSRRVQTRREKAWTTPSAWEEALNADMGPLEAV